MKPAKFWEQNLLRTIVRKENCKLASFISVVSKSQILKAPISWDPELENTLQSRWLYTRNMGFSSQNQSTKYIKIIRGKFDHFQRIYKILQQTNTYTSWWNIKRFSLRPGR